MSFFTKLHGIIGVQPKVTVCIPVYNGELYIREAVISVLNQTYQNIELIVQDNASTDSTWLILKDLEAKDHRIRCYRNIDNIGMAANWNNIIEKSSSDSDYVSILSADDIYFPRFIEGCVKRFLSGKDLEFVSANHILKLNDQIRRRRTYFRPGKFKLSGATVLMLNPFSINFTLFKKEAIQKYKMNNGVLFSADIYVCDYDLWLRMAKVHAKGYYMSQKLGAYRWHDSNLSHNNGRMLSETVKVISKHSCWLMHRFFLILYLTKFRMYIRAIRIKVRGR